MIYKVLETVTWPNIKMNCTRDQLIFQTSNSNNANTIYDSNNNSRAVCVSGDWQQLSYDILNQYDTLYYRYVLYII